MSEQERPASTSGLSGEAVAALDALSTLKWEFGDGLNRARYDAIKTIRTFIESTSPSSPNVEVIEGLDEAIEEVAAFFERDDGPVDECATTLLKAARAYAALPREQVTSLASPSSEATLKMQKVDLDVDELHDLICAGWNKHGVLQGENATFGSVSRAIAEDIKSKYGELYMEVK